MWEGFFALQEATLDLRTGWDFRRADHRAKAMNIIARDSPSLVIGSVVLHAHSHRRAWHENCRHNQFLSQCYRTQELEGRWYVHEEPLCTSQSSKQEIHGVEPGLPATIPGYSHTHDGTREVATTFYTNSTNIHTALNHTANGHKKLDNKLYERPPTCSGGAGRLQY